MAKKVKGKLAPLKKKRQSLTLAALENRSRVGWPQLEAPFLVIIDVEPVIDHFVLRHEFGNVSLEEDL